MITIYTDGSSIWNPGPWGWWVLVVKNVQLWIKSDVELAGGEEWTTNNRMELSAVIEALKWIQVNWHTDSPTTLYMDSMYVHNGIEKFLASWIARGWRLANKKPVLNKDLWMELNTLLPTCPHVIRKWVKAHATSKHNNAVDRLARGKALAIQKTLPKNFIPPVAPDMNTQKPLFF